jgi:CO/xanthine dehydrogenase FAD-binding subunit
VSLRIHPRQENQQLKTAVSLERLTKKEITKQQVKCGVEVQKQAASTTVRNMKTITENNTIYSTDAAATVSMDMHTAMDGA